MKNAWDWLNEKKTIFGLVLLSSLDLVDEGTLPYTIIRVVGFVLTGIGFGHKVVKGTTKKK